MARVLWIGVLAAALFSGPAQAATASFTDWTVVCDNVRRCTAFGFPEEGAKTPAFVKIERDAEADAPPRLTVGLGGNQPAVQLWSLRVDDRGIDGLGAVTARYASDETFAKAPLTDAEGAALMGALANGRVLVVGPRSAAATIVSLAGSSAALRWMDDQQKRAGTVTALVAKGPKPASAVPPPPPVPLARPGRAPSQAGVGEALPKSVRAQFGPDCDRELPQDMRDPISARLAPGVILWADVCFAAAYQSVYSLFLADETGGHVRPLRLDDGGGGKLGNDLTEVTFDIDTLTLSTFSKGRGLTDCGESDAWVWDGRAFRLSEQMVMELCRGLGPDDWPTGYVSRDR